MASQPGPIKFLRMMPTGRMASQPDAQLTSWITADDSSSRPFQDITNTAASLKRAHFWPHIKVELKKNMRLESLSGEEAVRQRQFGEYLLRLGDGREPTNIDLGNSAVECGQSGRKPRKC
ncbi:hypothetical protein WJX79_007353 [Trebouxia sp. C0005]